MTLVTQIRGLFYSGFMSLPLVLVGIILFLAASLGNLGLLMLSFGQILLVPFVVFVANMLHEFFFQGNPLFSVEAAKHCNLVPSADSIQSASGMIGVAPSHWSAQITFFFVFLMTNAMVLYNKPPTEGADPAKVANRKAQTLTAFFISFALFVALIVLRQTTGCETIVGTALGILIVAPIANGWYHLAALCGARDADVFGILQKILPQNMKDEPPMTCVYSP
jgi:hypothetical protein